MGWWHVKVRPENEIDASEACASTPPTVGRTVDSRFSRFCTQHEFRIARAICNGAAGAADSLEVVLQARCPVEIH